jgi:hypothetical protein
MRLEMKLSGFFTMLGASLIAIQPCIGITIFDDLGGSLGDYLQRFAAIRDSGESVRIDGSCFSACTLVIAMIQKQRICVTERAILGFHATWANNSKGQRVINSVGTELLYHLYPSEIRSWITRHGGLRTRTIVLKGQELATFYSRCTKERAN